jgi:hypothetical protein
LFGAGKFLAKWLDRFFVDPICKTDRWADDLLALWGLTIPDGSPAIHNVWHGLADFKRPFSEVHQNFLNSKLSPFKEMRAIMCAGVWRKYVTPPPLADRVEGVVYCDITVGRIVPKVEGEDPVLFGDCATVVWEWAIMNLPGYRFILSDKNYWERSDTPALSQEVSQV